MPRPSPTGSDRLVQRGFTLLEMVLVIVIIGVLAAIAAPRWSPGDATLHAQAARLARDLRHIQTLAMSQGRTLSFESLGNAYRCTDAGGTPITDPAGQQPFMVALTDGATLSAGSLGFDGLGRPTAGGALLAGAASFSLSGASQVVTLSVAPVTGFVTVSP